MEFCKTWFKKEDLSDPCFKLALIPTKSKLNFGTDSKTGKPTVYPLVSVRNVFIFPGRARRSRWTGGRAGTRSRSRNKTVGREMIAAQE